MSGRLDGTLDVDGERLSFDGGAGYHDHNWGFWQGVSWQWGQVQQGDLSLLYGRVFPASGSRRSRPRAGIRRRARARWSAGLRDRRDDQRDE